MIGGSASSENPVPNGAQNFEIVVEEDLFKEGEEFFALGLVTSDDCVCLGRDLSLAITPENGGTFCIVICSIPYDQVLVCFRGNLDLNGTFSPGSE